MKKSSIQILFVVVTLMLVTAACGPQPQIGTGGAQQVEDLGFKIPKNAQGNTVEQQNIIDRIRVTTDPTKVLWIHLIALDGHIILRTPVAHKVTSSGKRLEPVAASGGGSVLLPQVIYKNGAGEENYYYTEELIQPDGTFGNSDAYIFWFDPQHRYFQYGTAGGIGYLLTDFPIDLSDPLDAITGMYNADLAASQWQKLQEATMCQNEGKTYNTETGECK
jgi:hypothetical protein